MTEYRTKSGRVLTEAEIEALADEAERGYDVSHLAKQQAGERLVNQAIWLLDALCLDSLEVPLSHVDHPDTPTGEQTDQFRELRNLILGMARQLAEAERENGRLRQELAKAKAEWPLTRDGLLALKGMPIEEAVAVIDDLKEAGRSIGRKVGEALKADLTPPDPPASPAEGSEAATGVEGA